MKGELITSVKEVCDLAKQGKCVVFMGGRVPAAFIQNWQAQYLQSRIDNKQLYKYVKSTR